MDISNASQSARLSVFVYPNPARENLTVEYTNTGNEKVTIELLNLLGQYRIVTQPESNTGLNRLRLDTRTLAAGVYLLKISSTLESKTVRVIIE
jgi:hypothetical protein